MIEVTPWDFRLFGNIYAPVDEQVNGPAVRFCRHFLADTLDPRTFAKLWIAREEDRVLGVAGIRNKVDISVFRSIDPRATDEIAKRLNAHLADQGFRGQDVFLYMSGQESPESRCPNRESTLEQWGAKPAERYSITVR